ncbi:MAG: heavy metal translocating P-type ATPase [Oscillospiraceae bacterium]|nr:heavy metal translocating P-type ATPase [Oscillospiraceae bacterium]
MKEETYDIGGMHCAACSSAVERVTRKLEGVERSDVNLPMNRMTILYDENLVSPEQIVSKVEKAGFTAKQRNSEGAGTLKADDDESKALIEERRSLIAAAVLSVLLLYVSMGTMLIKNLPLPEIIGMETHPVNFALTELLLTIPILYIGRRFFTSGFNSLIHRNPNMDTLVAVSCTASFLYSLANVFLITDSPHAVHSLYFESAAIVITLVLLGKHLEAGSKEKTKSAITKLMELTPDTAILILEDKQWEVPTDTLKKGDLVLVKPGTKVPLDGRVIKGEGSADEAMLTGESMPVGKLPGSEVIGGSILVSGAIYAEITRVGDETTLSKIIKFVEDAQGKKAPISKTADKVAGVFVPIVMAIAAVALAVWLIAGAEFSFALRIFTSILVIACPCAMGLATPTAIIVGTGLGASKGILIRSGEALEITHKTNVVVLDKTGTVTEGKPRVTELISDTLSENELLALASGAESLSDHPLAKAITEEAKLRGLSPLSVSSFENLSGLGISAALPDGKTLLIGNLKLMETSGISAEKYTQQLSRLASQGQTPMLAAKDGVLLGIISVADTVKAGSRDAITKLRDLGVKTILLTGDSSAAASYIGSEVGTDEIIAEVLPNDKAKVVERLQKEGRTVMMVGDGINDAPALAQADIGCAIGNGSDIAIESADLVLMKSDLNDVPAAIKLSRLTIRNIKQNLFWAFCYNTLGIPIAAGVLYPEFSILLSPMIGALAMSLSSIFVVTNALRLRGKKL